MQGITTNKKELELKIEGVNEISISHTASSKSFATSVHLVEHQQRLNFSAEDLLAASVCSASLQNIYKYGTQNGINFIGTHADVTTLVDTQKSKIRRIVLDIYLKANLSDEQLEELRLKIDSSNTFGALGPSVLFEFRLHKAQDSEQVVTTPNVAA
tara:strand:+ start:154 stop:621 length:468 start_codon:yes stop_codon:yes gene_type:complete